jgi:hypothetical protein
VSGVASSCARVWRLVIIAAAAQNIDKASVSRRFIFVSALPFEDRGADLRLDPYIGALEALQEHLLIEFLEGRRDFECLRWLRAFLNIAQRQHGTVVEPEFYWKIEYNVDPGDGVVIWRRRFEFGDGAAG